MAKDIITRWKADTKDYDKNLARAKKQLEDFGKENFTAGGAMKQMTSQLVATAAKFASFGAAASTAMKVVKDSFMASESNIDEWGRTVEGAKGAYDAFLQTLNNGDWSNFFANLSDAIKGSRDLYDAFDRLGSIKNNNQAAIAILEQKLSQLRLLQQAGQNVSGQIASTTASLNSLKGMSVEAGKNAGVAGAANVIRNSVNSAGGRDITNKVIDAVVKDIMYNGQKAVDKYTRNYNTLRQKGMRQVVAGYDEYGDAYYTMKFDINRLNAQQRRQYLVAQAVRQRETALAPYIGTYATAIGEETAANRQTYRYNRYALQGARGGAGGRTSASAYIPAEGSIDAQAAKVQELTRLWKAATDQVGRDGYLKQLEEAQFVLDTMTGKTSGIPAMNYGAGNLGAVGIGRVDTSGWRLDDKAMGALGKEIARINEVREANLTKEVGSIANGIGGIVGGIEQLGIDLPQGMKDVLSGIQGVISILSAISTILTAIETLSAANTIIPFARGGVVRAAGGYTVPGNYGFDNVPALLSSGEVVLNRAQVGNLASQLQEQGRGGGQHLARVSGEQIYIAMNNYLRRSGKGELITWR